MSGIQTEIKFLHLLYIPDRLAEILIIFGAVWGDAGKLQLIPPCRFEDLYCYKDAQEFGIFWKFHRKLMYFSLHFHIKPHPLMVQYFSFNISKPTGPFPFTNIFFL